jgi:adenosine deaminase
MTRSLPDLHRHLDGSLRERTLRELAEPLGVPIPDDLRFVAGMGLDDALARFEVTLSVLQNADAVRRVAAEICEDAAADGVTTLEIRFAPQLHGGAAPEEIVDAAVDGVAGRAGIILCGLYGEPPSLLDHHLEIARTRPGVVGIDIAGGPTPAQDFRLEDYAPAFARARELGVGRTVHAGEGRPPSEIRVAIEQLFAQRIGHGTTLLDDERVLDLVLERDVVIEACPTSNVHTGIIGDTTEHPLPRWLERGVRACINTDNTLLSDVEASEEHANASRIPGMSEALLDRCVEVGHSARFSR